MNYLETIDIAISLDMSGSISTRWRKTLLVSLKTSWKNSKTTKLNCGVLIPTYITNDFDAFKMARIIMSMRLRGGGGTEFMCNWDYMKEHDIVPKKFIMFTDGYPYGSWGEENTAIQYLSFTATTLLFRRLAL
jgi:predicted metal-dependent peptidase